jgi:hypothetical protein
MRRECLVLWVAANDLLADALVLCVYQMSPTNAPERYTKE